MSNESSLSLLNRPHNEELYTNLKGLPHKRMDLIHAERFDARVSDGSKLKVSWPPNLSLYLFDIHTAMADGHLSTSDCSLLQRKRPCESKRKSLGSSHSPKAAKFHLACKLLFRNKSPSKADLTPLCLSTQALLCFH